MANVSRIFRHQKYVDITGLRNFKTNQDATNLTKFASLSGGKVTTEQLPSYFYDAVEGYAKEVGGVIGFYEDSGCTVAMAGDTGKIYVDLDAAVKICTSMIRAVRNL